MEAERRGQGLLPWWLCIPPVSQGQWSSCAGGTGPAGNSVRFTGSPQEFNRGQLRQGVKTFHNLLWYLRMRFVPWALQLRCSHCCLHHSSSRSERNTTTLSQFMQSNVEVQHFHCITYVHLNTSLYGSLEIYNIKTQQHLPVLIVYCISTYGCKPVSVWPLISPS